MNEQKSGSFMDPKTILAIVLTTIIWIGWQWHLTKKYPNANKPVATETVESSPTQAVTKTEAKTSAAGAPSVAKKDELTHDPLPEKLILVDGANWSFKISSKGMGLRDFELKKFTDRENKTIKIGAEVAGRLPFETALMGRNEDLDFAVEKVSNTHYVGRAHVAGNVEVVKVLKLDENQYRIDSQVELNGYNETTIGISTYLTDTLLMVSGGSFFAPQMDRQDVYMLVGDKTERHYLDPAADLNLKFAGDQVISIGTQYFTQALVDHSEIRPDVAVDVSALKKTISSTLSYPMLNRNQGMKVNYTAFMGPKDLELLKTIDPALMGVVDFGFFAVLGRPILYVLKGFHSLLGNWGFAIIFLTLLVRFLVLPFNVMSFKSMKGMQAIQPQLQALRTKYKDDATRLNQETMALFKEHKVNPLGGCLPMFLQIPVFFALYQVLGHSVELYHAPFGLWIHDLSYKDPYFVLPVLMGLAMFFQQKVTPTAMDPTQAKIMMFMPLVFSVFMLTLPSGLALYIFVSTLFGIVQQMYLMKGQPLKQVITQK